MRYLIYLTLDQKSKHVLLISRCAASSSDSHASPPHSASPQPLRFPLRRFGFLVAGRTPPLQRFASAAKVSLYMAPLLFEDTFTVTKLDPDGKKFDKVTRVEAQSDKFDAYVLLDVNTDIYPIQLNKRYTIGLATTLDFDGTPDTGYYNPGGRENLADRYDYVMHGRLYRVSQFGSGVHEKQEIYVSYGGLLMLLRVDAATASKFGLDQRLFLLMKSTE